jgi:UDP-N-acetylmuramyl pentapeptide phosphotransferase/UDP-N-acetylglucosamine-1-phosphate transferase
LIENPFLIFLTALGCTFVVILIILGTQSWHGHWTHDHAHGVQKFHDSPTPRVGGLGIILGLLATVAISYHPTGWALLKPVFLAGMVPFFFGFGEDITKKVSVRDRLLATMVGAGVYIAITGITLTRLDLPYVDDLMALEWVAICLTIFCVAGMTNATNILDGFNGLAGGVSLIQFFCLVLIAYAHNDIDLVYVGIIFIGVIIGFILLNYPFGKIFLGDAGAYFVGFALAWFAILLPVRHESVSPWASLLICAYPVIEALYSIYRRMIFGGNPGAPDNLHLHSLIKTRLVRRYFKETPAWLKNSLVAPGIWLISLFFGLYAFQFSDKTELLMFAFLLFVIGYHLIYRKLVELPEYVS